MSSNKKLLPVHESYQAHNDIMLALLPLLVMAVYMYGIRSLVMAAIALVTAIACDFAVAKVQKKAFNSTENSSLVIAMVLVMLLPASIDYYIIVVSVAVAVLVGKYVFGGIGNYPFNPSALGYVVAVIGWTDKVFSYPTPFTQLPVWGNVTLTQAANSPASTLALGGLPNVSTTNLLLGNYAGGIGSTATLVILSCFILLLIRKRVSFLVPTTFVATAALIAFLFPRVQEISRFTVMKYEVLSCSLVYAAVFLLSDATTLPKNKYSKILYGVVLGITTMMFRYYGSYEIGICFAILAVNSISGWLDRMVSKLSTKKDLKRISAAQAANQSIPTER